MPGGPLPSQGPGCTGRPHRARQDTHGTKGVFPRHMCAGVALLQACVQACVCGGQVEIHGGQLIGTLGRQQTRRQKVSSSSRLLSDMGAGTFFGSGTLLNGEGDLQVRPYPLSPIHSFKGVLNRVKSQLGTPAPLSPCRSPPTPSIVVPTNWYLETKTRILLFYKQKPQSNNTKTFIHPFIKGLLVRVDVATGYL